MRLTWLGIALFVGSVVIIWFGWSWSVNHRVRQELERAEKEMAGGRHGLARQRLIALAKAHPRSSEAAYQLGLCEEHLGHAEAALNAWSNVAANSPLFIKATIGRALVLMNAGRYAQAEDLLMPLPRDHGPLAAHIRQQIETLLRIEGRTQEARALIAESWQGASDPSDVLKRLFMLEDAPFPLDYVKQSLKRGDPNDDRVRLGQANLAIWQGRFDDAARWLDSCRPSRTDDQPFWLARLSLAMSSRDIDGARRAVEHVKAAWFLPIEVLRIRAWFNGFRGDVEAERHSLQTLLAEEPGNTSAYARLAELALQAGQSAEAESLRRRQSEMSALRERYARLLMLDQRHRHVDELGRLAKALGRTIEARGWSLIQQRLAATEPLWPANHPDPRTPDSSRVLAAIMNDLMPSSEQPPARPAANSERAMARFTDDAEDVGLRFVHDNGHTGEYRPPPETMCGGVGLLDYDGDGWLDVYAVQGGPFPPKDSLQGDGDRLFRNRGDGTFEDVTERAGIAAFPRGYGHGVTIGDYNNDGRPDLFVTRWKSYALYRNKGDGRFEDVTSLAGLEGDRDWPTSAAFADLDGDGDLDLYVCHYLRYDPANPKLCEHPESPNTHDCMPRDFPSLPDHMFRNDNGRFTDVTREAGFIDPQGRGLGVVAANLDDDNQIDLYVANDMSPNYLFHNLGRFRFEEIGEAAGAAVSSDGLYKSGMGIACGDLDGNGALDLAVTNFFGESTSFYRNLGRGLFVDHTALVGLLAPSRSLLGFGIGFLDVNNDGWLDLLSTNGHVLDNRPRIPLTMPLQLLMSRPGGHLTDVSDRAGEPFRQSHLGRGLAIGDLDNDGRLDAVVLNQNELLVYLHNHTEPAGHFIRFRLEGTRSNRDAIGARVTIESGGRRQMSERIGGGSYQSASDPRLHFGLGSSRQVESIDVRWPSGHIDHHHGLNADREYHLREGDKPREIKNGRAAPGGP